MMVKRKKKEEKKSHGRVCWIRTIERVIIFFLFLFFSFFSFSGA